MIDITNDFDRVVGFISNANRIMVIGCSGSGKSTLSKKIGESIGVHHISMDKHFFWLPGWVQRPKDEQRAMIEKAVKAERWIMDGTDPSSFDMRVPRADIIVWIRLPRVVSLFSALKRIVMTYGRTRLEMAPSCPERFDPTFMRYIWTFEKVMVPKIEKALLATNINVPIVTLKSFAESDRLIEALRLEKNRNAEIRNEQAQPAQCRTDVRSGRRR